MRRPSGSTLLAALGQRAVVTDGATGTTVRGHDLSPKDVRGPAGRNGILDLSGPDTVRDLRDAYLTTGCDVVETHTFGANPANLAEYGIVGRIGELTEAGAVGHPEATHLSARPR